MKRSMLKRVSLFCMASLMALSIAGCGGNSEKSASGGNVIKFALVTDVTGPAAAYGEAIKNAAELAVSQINEAAAKNNAPKIDLNVLDGKTNKNEVMNAVNKAINKDQALAIMGPMISGEMFAAGPIANKAKVVVFGTCTTAEGITDIGPYVFRNAIPESIAVKEAIDQSHKELGYKTAAIIYSSNNDQMTSVYHIADKELKALGVNVVDVETFADQDSDFSAQLTKVKEANPDIVVVAGLYQAGSLLVKKMRDMGMNQKIIGSNGFNSPTFIKIAGDAADGCIVGTPWFPNKDDQRVRDFRKAYKEKYGVEPDQFAAQAYDGIYMMYQAALDSGSTTDREKFRHALQNIKNFEGVTGKASFDENRNPKSEVQVLMIEKGKYVPLHI